MADEHSTHSTLREHVVEHVFVGEALRRLWQRKVFNVEVLRSEFDAHGYDLVMARGPVVRHIQFKTGGQKRPGKISVPLALSEKPSACVIWIKVSRALDLEGFFWFGGAPGESLPPIADFEPPLRIGRNKDGERPPRINHRLIPGDQFDPVETLDGVLERLFGGLPQP